MKRQGRQGEGVVTRGLRRHRGRRMCRRGLQFFAGVARRFYAPLALVCKPYRQVLARPGASSFAQGCIQLVGSGARHLGTLVRRIVRFQEVRAKRGAYGVRRIGVGRILGSLSISFSRLTRRGGMAFRVRISGSVC